MRIEESVQNFYRKEGRTDYFLKYEQEHGPRLDLCAAHFGLSQLRDTAVADYGCGYGFLFDRLHESNQKVGFDGADVDRDIMLSKDIEFFQVDLNDRFAEQLRFREHFDYSICFETLEHLENPYRCLVELKYQARQQSAVLLSIPHEGMTHNTVYPGLIYPENNFEDFLEQMALPIEQKVLYESNWPSWIYLCRSVAWTESRMKFPKSQFVGRTPVEYTNL